MIISASTLGVQRMVVFRSFVVTTILSVSMSSCKTRGNDSEVQESKDPVKNAIQKVDAFYLELGVFKKEVDQYFVPVVTDEYSFLNPEKIVKLSRIVQIESQFDSVVDALVNANLNLGDLKNRMLDQQRKLVAEVFPAVKYNMPDLSQNGPFSSLLNGMRGLQLLEERSRNWVLFDFCGEIHKGKKVSKAAFINLITDNIDGLFRDGRYVSEGGRGSFIMESGPRNMVWNLAGRPKVIGLVHTKDVWSLAPGKSETVTADTNQVQPLSKQNCDDYVAPHSPVELEKYPMATRRRVIERREFPDCPEKFKYSSWVSQPWSQIFGEMENLAYALERVENMDQIRNWFVNHCPQIAKSIDELRIEYGENAYPMFFWGYIRHKYKPGYTRAMSEDAFKDRLNAMIEVIVEVRNALGRSAIDEQLN
jgi:hypothetical protein